MKTYENIMNYDYKMKHQRMSIYARSAQFSPFSALTGYEELIKEKGRITNKKIELSIDDKDKLDYKLQILKDKIKEKNKVTITYFIKDLSKSGGKYETINSIIKRIDFINQEIKLENNQIIKISDIFDIDSDIVNINDFNL